MVFRLVADNKGCVMQTIIEWRIENAIAWVIIKNPAKRNALDLNAWSELAKVMAELNENDDLRCVIVRGHGTQAFAAGADIAEFPNVRANAKQAEHYGMVVKHTLDQIIHHKHPTIAMIYGACTGGGLEIACCCDLRISARSGRFGVPINRIGHAFAYPEMAPVLDVVGRALLLELLLEGCILNADEAYARGLINKIVDDAELEKQTLKTAHRIASGAPLAARANKRFINRLKSGKPLTDVEIADGYALCDSQDYQEGVQAFIEKRKPQFDGK